jgi:hypothetical protein
MNKRVLKVGGFLAVVLSATSAFAYTYTTQVTLKFADDVGGANNSGTFVIGNTTGRQVALDDNEVQARAANGGPSTLYVQDAGGLARFGGDLEVAGSLWASGGVIDVPDGGAIMSDGDTMLRFRTYATGDRYVSYDARHHQFNGSQFRVDATQSVIEGGMTFLMGGVSIPRFQIGGSLTMCMGSSGDTRLVGTCSSSRRYKTDIASLQSGLRDVMALRPVTYAWKESGERDLGFIAEEALDVRPELVNRDEHGEVQSFSYQHYTAVLTRAVQEQQTMIEDLRRQLSASEAARTSELGELRAQVAALALTLADSRKINVVRK